MNGMAYRLLELLTDKPQSKGDLQDQLHCGERDVRRAVKELRENGYNIASNSERKGYWLGDEEDRLRTIRELRSRARKLEKTAAALEKGVDLGQIRMEV